MSMEVKADQDEVDRCFKKFKLYCPVTALDELRDQIKGTAARALTEQLAEDVAFQKKYFSQLNRDVKALQDAKRHMEQDIKDRATQEFLNQSLKVFKESIQNAVAAVKDVEKRIDV